MLFIYFVIQIILGFVGIVQYDLDRARYCRKTHIFDVTITKIVKEYLTIGRLISYTLFPGILVGYFLAVATNFTIDFFVKLQISEFLSKKIFK